MHFTRSFKASAHCQPSPDGRFVATLFSSNISVRSTQSLEVVKVIRLPQELAGRPISTFSWSPASKTLLVAAAEQVHVFSALQGDFHGVIRNPGQPAAKPAAVTFGAYETEVCIASPFGLKLAVFDLASSTAVEISNPKFYATAATACRSFSFRPQTHHLAVLTRTSGKDAISLHHPGTRELQRSWFPDTVDAQELLWSPDGRWLVLRDAPGQGHKILFYTPDGDPFRAWLGPHNPTADVEARLGAGVKHMRFSPDARYLAIGDYSRCICMLDTASIGESLRLHHPSSVVPRETLQVWQQQVSRTATDASRHSFARASQTIYPPGRLAANASEVRGGCASASFDCSSALLATRLEEMPTTVWIWDLAASELRAVLIFHSAVLRVSWHPSIRETLVIGCEGDEYEGLAFAWDPLTQGPRLVDFAQELPGSKLIGKSRFMWLNMAAAETAVLFFADSKDYFLASLGDGDEEAPPWQTAEGTVVHSAARTEDSPLILGDEGDDALSVDDEGSSELDDTFHFKRGAGP